MLDRPFRTARPSPATPARSALAWGGLGVGLVLWIAAGIAAAGDPRGDAPARPDGKESPTLSAKEVTHYFEPYVANVRACYLDHAKSKTATGRLRLELIIHPSGKTFRFGFAAPGVGKPWLAKLDRCLNKLATTWRFPVRRGFTTAVIPFIFQRTNAPEAGPIESCWDPRGCPPGKEGTR